MLARNGGGQGPNVEQLRDEPYRRQVVVDGDRLAGQVEQAGGLGRHDVDQSHPSGRARTMKFTCW